MEASFWVWVLRATVGLTCLGLAAWSVFDARRRWPWLMVALVVGSVYTGFEGYLLRSADPWGRYQEEEPLVRKLRDFDPIFSKPGEKRH